METKPKISPLKCYN